MENIYFNNIIKKKVIINPKHMGNIDKYIENYLKSNFEGKCVAEGYIKPESIKIVRRSFGSILGSRFTGDITYMIEYSAEICNPVIGNVIECTVKNINKLGLLCNNGPITIIVGKKFHDNLEDINKIKEGDKINVEIIAKKIQLNKEEIQVVGKIFNNNNNIRKIIKKQTISSDITSIDIDTNYSINKNISKEKENINEKGNEKEKEDNNEDLDSVVDDEEKEEDEEEDVDYESDEMSMGDDLDDNIKFGDITFNEPEEENNAEIDDEKEEDDDDENDEEEEEEEDYDYK
jgi:DNA-directed RNA polymerase subunit E'/Rpb7